MPSFVYRFIPLYRLWEIIATNNIGFVRNSKWADPFEGYFAKILSEAEGRNYDSYARLKYFLCCTDLQETDFGWRIYTPNNDGVRLKISVDELKNAYAGITCQRINYAVDENEVRRVSENIHDFSGRVNDWFFYKQVAYKHEQEIRFFIEKGHSADILPVPIDPLKIIDGLLFDPRMPLEVFELHKKFILDKWSGMNVELSSLYDPDRALKKPEVELQL